MPDSKSVYRNRKILTTVLLSPEGDDFAISLEETGEILFAAPSARLARSWAEAYLKGYGRGYDDGADSTSGSTAASSGASQRATG